MILQTFESFSNSNILHDRLIKDGWVYNIETKRYDLDRVFNVTIDHYDKNELVSKRGFNFPIGSVYGMSLWGIPVKGLNNFPTKIGQKGINISNTDISSFKGWNLEYCTGNISADGLNISNLKGLEDTILHGDLDISDNLYLTSLEGIPNMPNSVLFVNYCPNLKSFYGIKQVLSLETNYNTGYNIIEYKFVNSKKDEIKDYWVELLKYIIDNKLNIEDVTEWPNGFLTDNMIQSVKGINKFKL